MAGMARGCANRHSKNKNYYASMFNAVAARKKSQAAARKRKAQSPGAERRRLVREAKHLASLAGAPARIAARIAAKGTSNA